MKRTFNGENDLLFGPAVVIVELRGFVRPLVQRLPLCNWHREAVHWHSHRGLLTQPQFPQYLLLNELYPDLGQLRGTQFTVHTVRARPHLAPTTIVYTDQNYIRVHSGVHRGRFLLLRQLKYDNRSRHMRATKVGARLLCATFNWLIYNICKLLRCSERMKEYISSPVSEVTVCRSWTMDPRDTSEDRKSYQTLNVFVFDQFVFWFTHRIKDFICFV